MTSTHKNRLNTTVSAVAGSGLGAFTISTASSSYRTFGAGDDGLTFDGILITEGTTWEVRNGCVYTHAGTSLARGTLMDSSTGSAITFTAAAIVTQGGAADLAARVEQAALNQVSGTDANTTMVVGTLYVVDMSAWATADRTYTLPTTAAVGDRISVMISAGDASHELILTAAASDTLNGIAGGTEWSRLFITGEVVTMRCVTANSAWIVEYDGRRGTTSYALSDAATTQTLTRNVATKITTALVTESADPSSEWDETNKKFVARRAGIYKFTGFCQMSGIALDKAVLCILYKNAAALVYGTVTYSAVAGGAPAVIVEGSIPLIAGDEIEFYIYHEDAATNRATFAGIGRVYFQGRYLGSE